MVKIRLAEPLEAFMTREASSLHPDEGPLSVWMTKNNFTLLVAAGTLVHQVHQFALEHYKLLFAVEGQGFWGSLLPVKKYNVFFT